MKLPRPTAAFGAGLSAAVVAVAGAGAAVSLPAHAHAPSGRQAHAVPAALHVRLSGSGTSQYDPIPNPGANVAASPSFYADCANDGFTSATCISETLAAINYARAQEGVHAMSLPSNYAALTPAEQMFVVANAERTDRGLPAMTGLSTYLDSQIAQPGANGDADPQLAGEIPGGGSWNAWVSNWAGDYGVLASDYDWMYYDGPGGWNIDCTSSNPSGCWGHRENILSVLPGNVEVMGGAAAPASYGSESYAMIVVGENAPQPSTYSPPVPPPSAAQVTAATNWVRAMSTLLLGTPWSSSQVDSYGSQVASGQLSHSTLMHQLLYSAQALDLRVNAAYEDVLHRGVDPSGAATWGAIAAGSGSTGLIVADLANSAEFWHDSGSTNAGYVRAMYSVVLHRAPDATGFTNAVNALNRGASRKAIAFGLMDSTEGRSDQVRADYLAVLQRPADAAGLTTWVNYLGHGDRDLDLIGTLTLSGEFWTKAQ